MKQPLFSLNVPVLKQYGWFVGSAFGRSFFMVPPRPVARIMSPTYWKHQRTRAVDALRFLQVWPCWIYIGGTDCDGYGIQRVEGFPTYWHAHRFGEMMIDGADGPMGWHQISKAEALEIRAELEA